MLNQLSDVMKKLAKEVMPKLVQDAHQKSSDALSERNRKLKSAIIDTGYNRVHQKSSERHNRGWNIIIKGLQESQSQVADDRRAFDTTLFERISNQVGLQEKPSKIIRLGALRANHDSSNCRPMHVVFCREDPELLAKRNVKSEDQMYWFSRHLTQSERKLEFEARKERRERQNVSGAHVTRSSTTYSLI